MNTYQVNQYQENQISTASPERILLMLYDGAIRFNRKAIMALDNDDPGGMGYGIKKTLAIVSELSNSLDHQVGGQIAEDLDALYHFMIRELTTANLRKERQRLENVDKLLVDMRATWSEAIEINKQEQSAARPAAPAGTAGQYGAAAGGNSAAAGGNSAAPGGDKPAVPENYVPLSISR